MAPPRQLLVQFVEHDIGQERRQRAALRGSFPDDDPRAVRHHDHRLQHPAHQLDHPTIRHPADRSGRGGADDELDRRTGRDRDPQSSGDRPARCSFASAMAVCAPRFGRKPWLLGVEGRLEHRLQNLEHGLLHDPVDHVGDAETPLPASGLRNEDPANVAGPVASLQQHTAQMGDELRRSGLGTPRPSVRRCPVRPCCAPRSAAPGRDSPPTPHLPAADWCRPRRRRLVPISCASLCAAGTRAARMRPTAHRSPPPSRAVGEHEAQLTVTRPSQPISPFAPRAFHPLHRSYEEIRLLDAHRLVVVASFRPTAHADPCQISPGKDTGCPAAPLPLPLRSRLDFGRRVPRHAHPTDRPVQELHLRSVLQFASGFFPTRPRGARHRASHDGPCCMQLPPAHGCYQLAP